MEPKVLEAAYPITFRKEEAGSLGAHIRDNQSVVLLGMKRVGIGNFLRYFIYHPDISKTYIGGGKKHLFFPIDLNDLVEREVFPFWALTMKRIVDIVAITEMDPVVKKQIEDLFLHSIQSRELFLVVDSVRVAVQKIVEQGYLPALFFLRFDRIKDAVTPEFFNNLQGLQDATHNKLTYIFTSFRNLDELAPTVFPKAALSTFARPVAILPLQHADVRVVFQEMQKRYALSLAKGIEDALFELVDGYVQYLQLAMIVLHEKQALPQTKDALLELLVRDERITLQSEELWESLTEIEQNVLMAVVKGKQVREKEKQQSQYLWQTGLLVDSEKTRVFSPLFLQYIQQKGASQSDGNGLEFTKKENTLFQFLLQHVDSICEREQIIEAVWPEVEALGVSDWAVDRLVARVRSKLKQQQSPYEIQTVKTRGYKLLRG